MFEDFVYLLKLWCKENSIIDKCHDNFWGCYEGLKIESPEEFSEVFKDEDRKNVHINLDKVKLCDNYCLDYGEPTIEIDFNILLKNKYIGWYREIYFTSGEFIDDYFVIDD